MGCFSWMFCDTNNEKSLRDGRVGYVLLPNGGYIKESCYDCYGDFAGYDIYNLVADWNRKFLSENPDFEIKSPFKNGIPKKVKEFDWYKVYSDLSLSREEVRKQIDYEYRCIGIDIACYDIQNAALPFPIKIASKPCNYNEMPPSISDPHQGIF